MADITRIFTFARSAQAWNFTRACDAAGLPAGYPSLDAAHTVRTTANEAAAPELAELAWQAGCGAMLAAVDPASGRQLRPATLEEAAAWVDANAARLARDPSLAEAVRVGEVIVDSYAGPGSNMLGQPLG